MSDISGDGSIGGQVRGPMSDPADLRDLLPHRPPFCFVDRVDHVEAGRTARARWMITGAEPWLAGHFPGRPLVPGVLLLEALAQTGAVAVLADPRHRGRLPVFGGVEEVRFRRQVVPGDDVLLEIDIEQLGGRGGWGHGTATVDGELACRGRLLFFVIDTPTG